MTYLLHSLVTFHLCDFCGGFTAGCVSFVREHRHLIGFVHGGYADQFPLAGVLLWLMPARHCHGRPVAHGHTLSIFQFRETPMSLGVGGRLLRSNPSDFNQA
jgi:hypothetical protein